MSLIDLVAGLGVGLAGGLTSGLLGVSPGGGLVVFSVLLLGAEQHVAQGLSLVAQIPPTSFAGVRRYRAQGSQCPSRWLAWLAAGFLSGGAIGAYAASLASASLLRWSYVAYLIALDILLIVRRRSSARDGRHDTADLSWISLLAVGLAAGLSSGFIGIGGGLATVVGLSAVLGVAQHRAQMIGLLLSLIPATLPSAWIYWQQGWSWSWTVLAGMLAGLLIGTDLGARLAVGIDRAKLQWVMIGFVSLMALAMIWKALA